MPITAMFDLWGLLVETVFGSVWASYFGLVILFFILCFILRMGPWLSLFIVFEFSIVFLTGYFGTFFLLFAFIGSAVWFVYALIKFIGGYGPLGN